MEQIIKSFEVAENSVLSIQKQNGNGNIVGAIPKAQKPQSLNNMLRTFMKNSRKNLETPKDASLSPLPPKFG